MADPFADVILEGRALVVELALPDSCDVVRVTPAGSGPRDDETETTIATAVKCAYSENLTQQDLLDIARRGITVDAVLRLPALQDITAADRLQNVTVGGVNFGAYEVAAVVRRSREVMRRILVRRAG
jgi:hypothetical protein